MALSRAHTPAKGWTVLHITSSSYSRNIKEKRKDLFVFIKPKKKVPKKIRHPPHKLKKKWVPPRARPHPSTSFDQNLFIGFCIILLRNKQINKQTQGEIILLGGGNDKYVNVQAQVGDLSFPTQPKVVRMKRGKAFSVEKHKPTPRSCSDRN